jgi:hypothetical protein
MAALFAALERRGRDTVGGFRIGEGEGVWVRPGGRLWLSRPPVCAPVSLR